jgi:hypothetical protein
MVRMPSFAVVKGTWGAKEVEGEEMRLNYRMYNVIFLSHSRLPLGRWIARHFPGRLEFSQFLWDWWGSGTFDGVLKRFGGEPNN